MAVGKLAKERKNEHLYLHSKRVIYGENTEEDWRLLSDGGMDHYYTGGTALAKQREHSKTEKPNNFLWERWKIVNG